MDEMSMVASTDQYAEFMRSYEDEIASLPFEHTARNRSFSDFLARLITERNALVASRAESQRSPKFIFVAAEDAAVVDELEFSASMQSHPEIAVLIIGNGADESGSRSISFGDKKRPDSLMVEYCSDSSTLPEWINESDYLVPFGKSDILNPALACTLSLLSISYGERCPEVWTWNVISYRAMGERTSIVATGFIRKPAGVNFSWLSGDVVGRSFAVRADVFRRIFPEGVGSLKQRRLLKSVIRLAASGASWRHHAEYFSLYQASDSNELLRPTILSKNDIKEILRGIEHRLKLKGEQLNVGEKTERFSEREPPVMPTNPGEGISVVVPFRDKSELTLRTIASVVSQASSTWIELILVDNQSKLSELERLKAEVAILLDRNPGTRIKLVSYPYPFNHSRQCNLGAQEATGETLVFLNNDATLVSTTTLDTLSRWAGLPNVATVGARIVRPTGEIQCAGFKVRQNPGCDYNSPMEESCDPLFSDGLREVAGNSFACAAIRRFRFLELGGLAGTLFPNGYNDIEFCMRALDRGYIHLMTGWEVVSHSPGTSRGTADEILQKVLVRDRYPQVLRYSQYQLETDSQMLKMSQAKTEKLAAGLGSRVFVERLWRRILDVITPEVN